MRRCLAVAAVVALVTGGLVPARAADMGAFVLDHPTATASWSGEVTAGVSPTGATAVEQAFTGVALHRAAQAVPCDSIRCDVAALDVALPAGTWSGDPGGMVVQIRWPSLDAGYDLDLAVYDPAGSLAARSAMFNFSRGESVWIPDPANGRYTAVVEPSLTIGQPVADGILETLRYEAYASFQRGRTIERAQLAFDEPVVRSLVVFGAETQGPLLPDVVPTTPAEFHVDSGWGIQHYYGYGDRGLRHQPSCYPSETLGLTSDEPPGGVGPLRCLRWTQGEYNLGDGPLELHIYPDVGDGTDVYQRVYNADGSVEQFGPMGSASFSQMHGHFHYRGWQDMTLRQLRADGTLGDVVRVGLDKGICMVDVDNSRFGQTSLPNAALVYAVPGTCEQPAHRDPADPTFPGERYFQMGISVGYADLYAWYLGDQYIDITGLADGRYALTVEQDVRGMLRELSTANNSATGCVEIVADTARDIPCR